MLTYNEMVWVWVGFGVAAGMVAMILPFRRGIVGLAINIMLGVLGSLLGGVIGLALNERHRFHDPAGLVLSAVFSVLTLGIVHALWLKRNPHVDRMHLHDRTIPIRSSRSSRSSMPPR
jgi:uncharacterized membrane protein YeaQ/YmgE (transglycosylase-associated protein family)